MLIEIGGKKIEALVDTGSTVSLLEESVVAGNVIRNNNVMLKTAGSGQGLFSSYEVIQGFSINKKEYSHDFLIVKSLNLPPIAVILGFDLISKFKFMIKAQETMKIILDGQVIPTVLSPSVTINVVASEREVCSYLLCTQDIVIPKCSVMCVKLKVVGKSLLEGTSVIRIRSFPTSCPLILLQRFLMVLFV